MLLVELDSKAGFEIKKLLNHSEQFMNTQYPEYIFHFNKNFMGEFIFYIDKKNEQICFSEFLINYLEFNFEEKPLEKIIKISDHYFKELEVKIIPNTVVYQYYLKFKNNKFKKIK